jgi:hypothetical protein
MVQDIFVLGCIAYAHAAMQKLDRKAERLHFIGSRVLFDQREDQESDVIFNETELGLGISKTSLQMRVL